MGKKARKSPAGESPLGQTIKDSASQIWLAGLGAFAKAQAEGGKVFEALVEEGGLLQRQGRQVSGEKVLEVSEKVSKVASDLSKQANQTWDKLEKVFEDRVARALKSLGVPTSKDLEALSARLDALTPKARSAAPGAPRAKPTTGGSAPKKSGVSKKSPPRKPAAKKSPTRRSGPAK